jgi:uncharacterized membrane protein
MGVLMDYLAVLLANIRIILGFLLVFLIPGYLISLHLFPRSSGIGIVERLAYSSVTSLGSVIACVLFMDVFLGIDTTPVNIVIVLTAFCLLLVILLMIRHIMHFFSIPEKVAGWISMTAGGSVSAATDFLKRIGGKMFRRD